MAQKHFGVVVGSIIEVRFAYSGKLVVVKKKTGDQVKRGDLLAALDRTVLQAELDRQLADYEKTRAEFEVAKKDTPSQKTIEQAQLNAAVKEVELAKVKLDLVDLFSPVTGLVLDDGNNVAGLNVTPSTAAFSVFDQDSIKFRLEIDEDDLEEFFESREVKVSFPAIKKTIKGTTQPPRPQLKSKGFIVDVLLETLPEMKLLPGMSGHIY